MKKIQIDSVLSHAIILLYPEALKGNGRETSSYKLLIHS